MTSADMVIHYDPWWNLSVENQATDRTHRIGQTKKVQVYKLITKNSIEEKMYDLQKRKEELIDNMLSTDTKFINKLSKEVCEDIIDRLINMYNINKDNKKEMHRDLIRKIYSNIRESGKLKENTVTIVTSII